MEEDAAASVALAVAVAVFLRGVEHERAVVARAAALELVRHAAFGFETVDFFHIAVLIVLALVMWRVAVNRMEKRLID